MKPSAVSQSGKAVGTVERLLRKLNFLVFLYDFFIEPRRTKTIVTLAFVASVLRSLPLLAGSVFQIL